MIKVARQILTEAKLPLLSIATITAAINAYAPNMSYALMGALFASGVVIWKGDAVYKQCNLELFNASVKKEREAIAHQEALIESIRSKARQTVIELKHLHDREVGDLKRRVRELSDTAEDAERTLGDAATALEAQMGRVKSLQQQTTELRQKVAVIDLTCPYCNTAQPVDYSPISGETTCSSCHNLFAIHTNIFTARITSPLAKE